MKGTAIVSGAVLSLAVLALIVPIVSGAGYDLAVVRGDIPTDYVIASIYANSAGIPVVLVSPDSIPRDIEMGLLGYAQSGYTGLLIIGGKEAISTGVEDRLQAMGFSVSRLWDWNRYGTAARVAIDLWGKAGSCVIVNGENYQDFLVAQRAALNYGVPILFSMNSSLTTETTDALERLEVSQAYLVGNGGITGILGQLGITARTIRVEPTGEMDDTAALDLDALLLYSILIALALIILIALVYIRRIFRERVSVPSMVLTPEEQDVVKAIKNSYGAIKQNKLPGVTGFSRPKVCRLVKVLEERGIIKREKKKKTYVLKLKSRVV
jgi:hypothetical protein